MVDLWWAAGQLLDKRVDITEINIAVVVDVTGPPVPIRELSIPYCFGIREDGDEWINVAEVDEVVAVDIAAFVHPHTQWC